MRTQHSSRGLFATRCAGAILFATALAAPADAIGDPFYLRYDADEVFPEQAGWTRYEQDPQGVEKRSLDDGWLVLDTRGSYDIFDVYYVRASAFVLQPGEVLCISWRMQVLDTDAVNGWQTDVSVFFSNAARAFADIRLAPGYVAHSEYGVEEPDHLFSFAPGVPHTYLLTSTDAQHFQLAVDGAYAFSGTLVGDALVGGNYASFGDEAIGLRSLSRWDYVQIEVAPEPGAPLLLGLGGALVLLLTRRVVP